MIRDSNLVTSGSVIPSCAITFCCIIHSRFLQFNISVLNWYQGTSNGWCLIKTHLNFLSFLKKPCFLYNLQATFNQQRFILAFACTELFLFHLYRILRYYVTTEFACCVGSKKWRIHSVWQRKVLWKNETVVSPFAKLCYSL